MEGEAEGEQAQMITVLHTVLVYWYEPTIHVIMAASDMTEASKESTVSGTAQ